MMKRLLAMMLSIVMVISMVPVQAFAQEETVEETVAETQPAAEIVEETTFPAETEAPVTETSLPAEETEAPIPMETTAPAETEAAAEPTLPEETAPPAETIPEAEETIPAETVPSLTASAEAAAASSGTCGTGVTWSLSNSGILTISGSGKMNNYSSSSTAPWFAERLSIKAIVISEGVTQIGQYAFYYCVNAESVSIPSTVTSIGYDAFSQCTALKSAVLPQGVKTVSDSLFNNCTSLTQVSIPDSVTTISSNAFYGCSSLERIDIPASVTSLGNYVFVNCASLKSAVIPSGVKNIGSSLFYGCTSLESVTIPYSVTSIYSGAFYNCTSLKEISIPASVTSIDDSAFAGCTSLTAITLPRGIANISSYLFDGCTALKEIVIPQATLNIESYAFRNCTSLTKVTMSAGILTIGSYAFEGCTGLTEITLPDGVTAIHSYAFQNCTKLARITLPDSITSIGSYAFSGCTALTNITLPGSLKTIESRVFHSCTSLESVELPDGLTTIGQSVFYGCTALQSVDIPDSVVSIGTYAFYGCTNLGSITIPGSVERIGENTFEGCTSLRYAVMKEGVKAIDYDAFEGCTALSSVSIPSTVTSIGSYAFRSCPNLKMITFSHLSSAELTISNNAFYLNDSYNYQDVATAVYVPYARDIHKAISGYQWADYGRDVTYHSFGRLPAETITIDPHPAQIEAGLEVVFTAQMDPWYSTSELIWEVKNGTGKAVIDQNGVLIGTEPGYVTVCCKSSDDASVRDESQIQILKASATVESIDIRCDAENEAEVELGQKVQMIADVLPGNAANKAVSWEVENGSGSATITAGGILTGTSCGTVTVFAMAKDGSEVVGSRVIEVLRYVTDIAICINGAEETTQVGVAETAALTAKVSPENASYLGVTWTVENGTGEAQLSSGFLKGISAGTVTLIATSQDSRKLTVRKEIEIVGERASFAATGGNLYYNTVTGTIIDCDESVTSANIPATISGTRITAIAPEAFYSLDSLSSVTIPSSVTHIGDRAFYDCDALTSLRFLGNGLKSIGESAFRSCEKLVNLTIPDSVVSVGENAFYYLYGLKNLTISGELDTRGWLSYSNTLDSVTFTGTKIIPKAIRWYDQNSYSIESMPGRDAKKVIIRDTVTEIGDHAFQSQENLEEITMGSGVTAIGTSAFQNCDSLTSITLGSNVKTVGASAFQYCYQLTEVVLPEGIETLGESAFSRCTSLEKINLPDSLKSIGRYCFSTDSDNYKLQLIDLSGNPTKMSGAQMQLTYNIPTVLVKGSNNQNRIYWRLMHTEENPNPYEIAGIDKDGILFAQGSGTVTVACEDEYTGACGTWEIELSSGIMIFSETGQDVVVSGDTLQLLAMTMPGYEPANVIWSIREQDKDFATINQKGKLTARAVTSAHQIEVMAQPTNGSERATLLVWIVPRTTGLYIYEGSGDISGSELDVDMALIPSMQFTAVSQPEGAMDNVIWVSSNEDVASVDDGLVTFNGPGTVTITVLADDGSGKSASVKINVTYRDTAKTLTATVDAPDNTLQAGEWAQMRVYGADPEIPLDIAMLQFGIPDSQKNTATVDSTGLITAGETPGTVTVTASLKGDPLGRRVSIKLTVIARQTERLVLRTDAPEPAQVQMLDADGYLTTDAANADRYTVLLRKADVETGAYSFVITPEAFNSAGSSNPGAAGLKWATSNSKIATVSVNKDGTAVVTVKRGAVGACVISAVTTDAAKVENELSIHIRDYSPRLETQKPALNTYLTQAAVIGLVPSYDNDIVDVVLLENGAESERLIPSYEDGVLTISAEDYIPNGTLTLVLKVTCSDGTTYDYTLTAKVKNTAPDVTVKQQNKIDLFYTDSTAVLTVTAKNEQVADVELADSADFTLVEFDPDTGEAVLQFSDDYIIDHSKKADTKASLLVHLNGYSQPVEKAVTIATQTKKPSVQTSVKSSTVNIAVSDEKTAPFGFVLKGSTELLPLDHAQIDVTAGFADSWVQNDQLVLTLTGNSGGTATILLQLDNWMEPIKLTHKVTVTEKAASLKFGKGTLDLNSIFTEQTDSTAAMLSQSNLEISAIAFESAAKPNTALRAEADKLSVSYDPYTGMVTAEIMDPDDAPKPGTYAFTARASVLDGKDLAGVTLKVKVSASAPTVKLKNSTLKLNRMLSGEETAAAEVTLSSEDRYSLVGFDYPDNYDQDNIPLDLNYEDGQLTAQLLDENAETKTHTIKLTPVVLDEMTGQEKSLSSTISVKVTVYSKDDISVSLSSKGKLDAIDPNSEIRYTVTKITNACGSIDGVSLEGPDADLFDVCLNEDGTVSLKLLPGEEYSTKNTYKVQFSLLICGRDVLSNLLSFKVYQSALKLSLASANCILYQSQTMPLTVRLTLDSPEGAMLEDLSLDSKSAADFLNAMNGGEMDVEISDDGRSAEVTFDVRNAASLASGKTYTLYLNATALGSASDAKVNQLKVTVQVK